MIKSYEEVLSLEENINEIHPIVLGRKYGIHILFEKALYGKVSKEVVSKVFEIGGRAPSAPDEMSHFPCYHFHLLEAFVFSDMPKEALRCLEYIKSHYPYFDQNHQSGMYQILGAYSAWVIAKLGQPKEALEMLKQVDTRFFGLKIRNYFQIELDLIWSDVLFALDRHVAAIPKLNSVIKRSRNFKFKWSESKAIYMMGSCYVRLGEVELGEEYYEQAATLNSDNLFIAKD
jgi:tetratricopeptide (TPR) repeat protein